MNFEDINDDKIIMKKITEDGFRLPDPQHLNEESTTTFYNNIITKCWSKCYVIRPTFKELKTIFYNYFDVFETDYKLSSQVQLNENLELINYETCDLISLDILLQSGCYSEIWKGFFFLFKKLFSKLIFKGRKFVNNQVVIVKKLKKLAFNSKSLDLNMKKFFNESKILEILKNENIIELIGLSRTHEFYIILEYMRNGNLETFLKSSSGKLIDFIQIIDFAEQISNGMKYLENSKIIHADLAARNILLGERNSKNKKFYKIKITDFEFSYELGDKDQILVPIKNSCFFFSIQYFYF